MKHQTEDALYDILTQCGGVIQAAKKLGITRGAVDKWKNAGQVPIARVKDVSNITKRHPKDVLRSIAHELVHHKQNEDGEFDDIGEVGEGYAQSNDKLRGMERQAYEMEGPLKKKYLKLYDK